MIFKNRRVRITVGGLYIALILPMGVPTRAYSKDQRSLAELKNSLVSGKPQEQLSAMDELAKRGPAAIDSLCDVIENISDFTAKERASQTLEKVFEQPSARNTVALDRLGRMLASPNRKIVESAGKSLMQFKRNARARSLLKDAARDSKDADTTSTLLSAIMVSIDGDKTEIPFFIDFLKHDSPAVRIWTAGYLGALGNKEGLDECKRVLAEPPTNDKVRTLQMRAAIAAGRIGDPSLIPLLERVGGSPEYDLASREARNAIREIRLGEMKTGDQRIDYLRKALMDDDAIKWGIHHLMAIGDAPSVAALEWARENSTESGRHAAGQALLILRPKSKGK